MKENEWKYWVSSLKGIKNKKRFGEVLGGKVFSVVDEVIV